MYAVVLTGGIGSGKTTVSQLFAEFQIDVIDADVIAHHITAPGTPVYQALIDYFGPSICKPDATLDRPQLRRIVFQDPEKKQWLEAQTHPAIRLQIEQQVKQSRTPYCLVVIPLFRTKAHYPYVQRVCVVDVDPQLQLERASQRDHTTPERIKAIMNAQSSREQRLALADDVIHNNGDIAELKKQVAQLHSQYHTLSGGPHGHGD